MDVKNKLAIFDIDGTIADQGIVPDSVYKGIEKLREAGYKTTVATGRSYWHLKRALQENFYKIISDDTLVVVEHGSKIIDTKGNIVFINEFGPEESNHVFDFIRANSELFTEIWYSPPEPGTKSQHWVNDISRINDSEKRYGEYADVFTCSLGDLKDKLTAQKISNLEARFAPYISVQNIKFHFTRSNIDMIMGGGIAGFFKNNVNKGLAVLYVANKQNVDLDNIIVAANGINDLEMLDMNVGSRILVGNDNDRNEILGYLSRREEVLQIESPEKLGEYLQTIQ